MAHGYKTEGLTADFPTLYPFLPCRVVFGGRLLKRAGGVWKVCRTVRHGVMPATAERDRAGPTIFCFFFLRFSYHHSRAGVWLYLAVGENLVAL